MNQRRVLRKRRWSAEPWSTHLLGWLNAVKLDYGKSTPASRQRILDLLQRLQETLSLIESMPKDADLINRPPRRLSTFLDRINDRLAPYHTSPFAYIELDGTLAIQEALAGKVPVRESFAARADIQLANKGLLHRLRKCICGKYLYANFSHQKYCSALCRHEEYEQTEEFKEQRRVYMRNYYRLKISGNVK